MKRTEKQIIAVVRDVLDIPAQYDSYTDCFELLFYDGADKPSEAIFGEAFVELDAYAQDTILQHEKGHIVSTAQHLPAHEEYDRLWDTELEVPDQVYYAHEAEADLYAAKQVGLDRVIKAIKQTLAWNEKWKRAANLLRLWNEQEKPLKWHRRVWLML